MIDKFYIPTLGRVENQITYNNLPDELKSKVIMVVQEDEKELYDYDVDYLVVENRIGIAKTRELICRDAGKTRFSMWDDDEDTGQQRVGETTLIPMLTKAIQELSAKVEELEDKLK